MYRKVLFGAHIQVVVLDMVQYGIDTDDGRDTDGAGRQADVPVSVVGAFYVQVVMVNSSEGEIAQGKLDRRVGLQGMPVRRRLIYMPATMGFSALLAVSSSTMEAKVTTSFGVNPAASARRSFLRSRMWCFLSACVS